MRRDIVFDMVRNCYSYADEIQHKQNIYPKNARISLRDLFKFDVLTFLGYIFDKQSSDEIGQVNFINDLLELRLNVRLFDKFRRENCREENFLAVIPESIKYFVKDDKNPYSRRTGQGISISKYVVNCLNDIGCAYAAYNGVSEYESARIWDYINMLNEYLAQFQLDQWATSFDIYQQSEPEDTTYNSERYGTPAIDMPGRGKSSGQWSGGNVSGGWSGASSGTMSGGNASGTWSGGNTSGSWNGGSSGSWGSASGQGGQSNLGQGGYTMVNGRVVDPSNPDVGMTGSMDPFEMSGAVRGRTRGLEPEETLEQLMDHLTHMIGLAEVKKNIETQVNLIKIQKMRQEMNLPTPQVSLHLVFSGNPGTGKTTVARLLAKIYKQLGVVSSGQFVEVDRSGLVEGYVGQTATKTSEVIDSAMGGILFIDEAYTLTNNKEKGDYGQEAVDTLLKRMEDDRDKFVVIVAGYTDPMNEFVESNPGLKSRFSKFVEFPDYSGDELMAIFMEMLKPMKFNLDDSAMAEVQRKLHGMAELHEDNFANGREVRNFLDRCIERQANRLAKNPALKVEDLLTFTLEDVKEEAK